MTGVSLAGVEMAPSSSSGPAPQREDRAAAALSLSMSGDAGETPVPRKGGIAAPPAARPSDKRVEWVRSAVARFERPLTQYATHVLGGDVERARDLVQEVFLRLCDQEQEAVESHLAEWLYTVCRNLAIDARRKERRMRLITEEQEASFTAENESPTEAAERVDAYGRVVEAMAVLPPRQQEIVRLKFQHGMSYKQIGEVMKLTSTNVGFILHTAIKALRDQLAEERAE